MGNIIDFNKAKEQKQCENVLEENYLKVLSGINKMVGIPQDVIQCSEVFYYIMRYLEGTVNCLGILTMLPSCDREIVEGLKSNVLNWMDSIRDEIQSL